MHTSLSCSQITKLSKPKYCSLPQFASKAIIVGTKEILFHFLLNALTVLEECPDFLYLFCYINKAENFRELKSFEEMPFNPRPGKITESKPKLFTKKNVI